MKHVNQRFWKAAESTNRAQFENFCNLAGAEGMEPLKDVYRHWTRFGIREVGSKRYRVHANNWAESLNNAFRKIRHRPLFHVLHDVFRYTNNKFEEYCSWARKHESDEWHITHYAKDIYDSNCLMARNCTIVSSPSTKWTVREGSYDNDVTIDPTNGSISCSCFR